MKPTVLKSIGIALTIAFTSDLQAQPNIVFYLADDQDIGDYGCYGNERVQTPAVDRLAREGMRFTHAFTGQAICAPSRSQLYTGNYPLRNGAFLNHVPVKDDQVSIASYLGNLGYEVILAGKSHVEPDSVFTWTEEWPTVDKDGVPREYIPLEKIESYFKSADKPFCMFIASMYPHGPYFEVEGASAESIKFYPYNQRFSDKQSEIDKKAGYYRSIEEDNAQLERVLELVDTHLDPNTLFIYSSDHGVSGKYTVYDRGLNVPFVARWPGVIAPGSLTDRLVHYTDILPTLVEIAGGTVPAEVNGKSFYPILKGSAEPLHEYVYGVSTNQNILAAKVFPSRMIRSHRYKYIRNLNALEVVEKNLGDNPRVNAFIRLGAQRYPNTPYEELYDLENDPYEQINLAGDPRYAELQEEMATQLLAWMKAQNDILSGEPGTMPLIHSHFKLDKPSKWNKVPAHLENTLQESDYLKLHF
ncbi:sulfatase [Pelagicoccus sp. SDUM812005]|uniref:sulfatase family protein n=1 Tax=Pelagicoccus sp. SDUM812005 TaxID=3041257 RepID=UPI00280C6DD4|nr:sulfatase [Pelagicoccus sp. SDUM812005]MDQ8183156.1 sulfatase [Pelagicoccus sp. SDUM812005]